ncbi:hypothetical protein HUU05_10150 [candidate division KSB1 bacterium]|nr:hypothetical protein [candidate division KSB1 bacterium]
MPAQTPAPAGAIEFVESHRPQLDSGDYTIAVEHTISASGKISEAPFRATRKFSVLGPRFAIDPQEVVAVFPAPGSLGEHSNVMPHLTLKRSTLPWERLCDHRSANVPWLALLLFDEEEEKAQKITTTSLRLAELKQSDDKFPKYLSKNAALPSDEPYLVEETGEHADDKLTIIDVDKTLLRNIAPKKSDLQWLAHVRRRVPLPKIPQEEERAVLICNRLPQAGHASLVHLVSLEGRYQSNAEELDLRKAGNIVRLISLKSWRFTCLSAKQSFKGALLHLNHQLVCNFPDSAALQTSLASGMISTDLRAAFTASKHELAPTARVHDRSRWEIRDRARLYLIGGQGTSLNVYNQAGRFLFNTMVSQNLAAGQAVPADLANAFARQKHPLAANANVESATNHWWLADANKVYFMTPEDGRFYIYFLDPDLSATLRLPQNTHAVAEQYLRMGSAPLRHEMRQGNKAVSWYHGPLVPGKNNARDEIELPVRGADQLVRYNSEYGMFDVSYAAAWELGRLLALQNKRFALDLAQWKRNHAQARKAAEWQLMHLPIVVAAQQLELPKTVRDWLADLEQLKGVPFNYLVPEETMLPQESLRFFQIDPLWVECLLDGAYSIGRVSAADFTHERVRRNEVVGTTRPAYSGFMVRSNVIADWPGLLIEGFVAQARSPLSPLRRENFSSNVLFCLFEGELQAVEFHLKPETLHFGWDQSDSAPTPYFKALRDRDGLEKEGLMISFAPKDGQAQVLEVDKFAKDMKAKLVAANLLLNTEAFTSAQFGMQMIAGIERVRFDGETLQ